MGNIMLLKEEYNKLHGIEVKGRFDSEEAANYYCDDIDGEIHIIERIYDMNENGAEYIESEAVVARFNADTPEGEIFSRLANCCMFQFYPNEDGKSLSVVRNCFWCDKESNNCSNYTKVKYKILDKIHFIDPVEFRDENTFLTLEMWKNTISRLAEKSIQSEYGKISKINEAVKQLQSQLIEVYKEWEYK